MHANISCCTVLPFKSKMEAETWLTLLCLGVIFRNGQVSPNYVTLFFLTMPANEIYKIKAATGGPLIYSDTVTSILYEWLP